MLADRILSEESLPTWMYLDTADPPVVTCGVGHALFILEDCLARRSFVPRPRDLFPDRREHAARGRGLPRTHQGAV
jgi:hypothetical protein